MTQEKVIRKRVRNRDTSKDYIPNKKFHELVVRYYETGKEIDLIPVMKAVKQLAARYGSKFNFANYSWKDEMLGAAETRCLMAIYYRKYNPERTQNAFSYFTMIAHNEFLKVIKDEKRQTYYAHKALEAHIQECMLQGIDLGYPEDDGSGSIAKLVAQFEKPADK